MYKTKFLYYLSGAEKTSTSTKSWHQTAFHWEIISNITTVILSIQYVPFAVKMPIEKKKTIRGTKRVSLECFIIIKSSDMYLDAKVATINCIIATVQK